MKLRIEDNLSDEGKRIMCLQWTLSRANLILQMVLCITEILTCTTRYVIASYESRLTIEMTWGETSYTQAEMKEESLKQSRCFALTSND